MNKQQKGFTLIELLVVVLIIGILAAVAVPQYQVAVKKARVMEGITTLQLIHRAQQRYQLTNGKWSNDIDVLDVDIPAGSTAWRYYCFSSSGCVATTTDPDLPDFEVKLSRDTQLGENVMDCRFYDAKTVKARQFCKQHLNCFFTALDWKKWDFCYFWEDRRK